MNEQDRMVFLEMQRQLKELTDFMNLKKQTQITFPVDDTSRKNMGIGFIGKTADTTAAGSLLVNSPEGPIKILYAS